MADVIYRVIFDASKIGGVEFDENKQTTNKVPDEVIDYMDPQQSKQKTSENIAKSRDKIVAKSVAVVGTAYNFGSKVADLAVTTQTSNYELNGDFVSAKRLQNSYAVGQEIAGNALALGLASVAFGGAGALVIAGNLAINYAFKAFQTAQQNRKLIEQQKIQTYLGQIERERFIRNQTTERVR